MGKKFWMKDGKILVDSQGRPYFCEDPPPCCGVTVACCGNKIKKNLTLTVTSTSGTCASLGDYPLVYDAGDSRWKATVGSLEIHVRCGSSPAWEFLIASAPGSCSPGVTFSPFNPTANCSPLLLQFGQAVGAGCCDGGSIVFEVTE